MLKKKFPSLASIGSDGNTAFLRAARAGHLDKVLEQLKNNVDINTSNANGLNALHLASKDGHINVVSELLKRGAKVDSATKKGNTALHIASLAGQEEVVKHLVEHGASVNVQSQNGFTPLYMAAQENHDAVVRFLLANGGNQSLATEDGFTPLAVAMQQGHDKVVAVLLENDTRGKVRLPALHIAAKKDDTKAAALLLQNEHNPDVTSKSGFTPLHIASHYGNEAIANLLLSKGADVNFAAKHNITPLHVAAKWGKSNMVSVLLSKGANIEAKTRDGLTPLHCAARSGHEQVVDMLLERGAPISAKTKNGLAALHMSSQGDHVDAARILLYHRAPVDDVTVDYLTALHVAAHCGHVSVARLLLDRKADPNARALNGFTPLHIACKKNRIKVVELLLKHGASIEATTESGLTPLHVASFMGCMNIVIYLVQNEAGPDIKTVRGETPLHLAARANQTDIIRILLRNGAQVDARAREQQTPLHIASRLGNVDIVMLLLQHGASVDSTTKDLYTALHIAAKEGQDEVASVLLENGASLEATTKKGFTPLHLAAKYGHMNVAKLLLRRDAPVDAQGKNGVTPLHVASHYDHQNVALLLLEKGASPHATAKNGHTPLHIAARKNQMDIATTLLEYGAKANSESKAGFTPLHLSAQEGHADMSNLLIEHEADVNQKAKNGLTPLHLCSQEDRVEVGGILLKNQADVDSTTKAGYTPLHVACHFGQMGMVRLLLANGASVKPTTAVNYTPLHQAAQQGHSHIVNELLSAGADPNATTNQGQTAMYIAQKLGYISVIETLKGVTDTPISPTSADEKYKVVSPETMQETFMSDSEDEGGEDTMLSEQPYHYLTVDEMRGLGDDSLPIDVTRDERDNRDIDDTISPQHMKESYTVVSAAADNVDINRHPLHVGKLQWRNFLVSFLVDARGGAMRGVRHSGVRVIVPPRRAPMPLRVTCRYLKRDKLPHSPPLMEGEALASRILELGPVGAKFLGPVMIEVPHFGALRGKEREIVILRSDNGETWREHTFEATEEAVHDVLGHSFEKDEIAQFEENTRTTRILTTEFPHYIAVVSRVRQEVHAIGPEGGMVSSTVVPQVQAVFPHGALTKKIKVGLQAQPIPAELTAKLLGNRVAVSPIVTVEPRRRKFHKPISLTIPVPQAANKGMINQYSGDAPTLRLLCSITGGTTRAQWEDVTGSTPLTFVNDCVSFTTTVSARFWLMDCRNISEATKMATELYREAIHVPFMAKFVVFAKRVDTTEARLRVFCMTDDKEDKTLEHQEHFTEVSKSRDVEVLEGKTQYLEFAGNLIPVTKSGEQLQLGFRAFKENRLPFTVRVKDPHADAIGRTIFMREPKVAKGDVPQQPICILNIVLPEEIIPEPDLPEHEAHKHSYITHTSGLQRLSDISNLLGEDWVRLAGELGVSTSEVNSIKTDLCESSVAHQGLAMLRLWLQNAQPGASASNTVEQALRNIGREDIIQQTVFQTGTYALAEELSPSYTTKTGIFKRIPSEKREIIEVQSAEERLHKDQPSIRERTPVIIEATRPKDDRRLAGEKDDRDEKKYEAEEKAVEEESLKSVSDRKKEIEKRLSQEVEEKTPATARESKIPSKTAKVTTKETLKTKETVITRETKETIKTEKKKLLDDTTEKETAEEKAVSPEPAHLSFDEKRKSFEMGITPKEKLKQQDSLSSSQLTQPSDVPKKAEQEVTESPKETSKADEEEAELSFAEKRRSFEQGLSMKQPGDKLPAVDRTKEAATDRKVDEAKRASDFRRDSTQLLQEVSQGLDNIGKGIEMPKSQVLLSPGMSKTPPPSPAEFSKDEPDNKKWSIETESTLLPGQETPREAVQKGPVDTSWITSEDQGTDSKKTKSQETAKSQTQSKIVERDTKDKAIKRQISTGSSKKSPSPEKEISKRKDSSSSSIDKSKKAATEKKDKPEDKPKDEKKGKAAGQKSAELKNQKSIESPKPEKKQNIISKTFDSIKKPFQDKGDDKSGSKEKDDKKKNKGKGKSVEAPKKPSPEKDTNKISKEDTKKPTTPTTEIKFSKEVIQVVSKKDEPPKVGQTVTAQEPQNVDEIAGTPVTTRRLEGVPKDAESLVQLKSESETTKEPANEGVVEPVIEKVVIDSPIPKGRKTVTEEKKSEEKVTKSKGKDKKNEKNQKQSPATSPEKPIVSKAGSPEKPITNKAEEKRDNKKGSPKEDVKKGKDSSKILTKDKPEEPVAVKNKEETKKKSGQKTPPVEKPPPDAAAKVESTIKKEEVKAKTDSSKPSSPATPEVTPAVKPVKESKKEAAKKNGNKTKETPSPTKQEQTTTKTPTGIPEKGKKKNGESKTPVKDKPAIPDEVAVDKAVLTKRGEAKEGGDGAPSKGKVETEELTVIETTTVMKTEEKAETKADIRTQSKEKRSAAEELAATEPDTKTLPNETFVTSEQADTSKATDEIAKSTPVKEEKEGKSEGSPKGEKGKSKGGIIGRISREATPERLVKSGASMVGKAVGAIKKPFQDQKKKDEKSKQKIAKEKNGKQQSVDSTKSSSLEAAESIDESTTDSALSPTEKETKGSRERGSSPKVIEKIKGKIKQKSTDSSSSVSPEKDVKLKAESSDTGPIDTAEDIKDQGRSKKQKKKEAKKDAIKTEKQEPSDKETSSSSGKSVSNILGKTLETIKKPFHDKSDNSGKSPSKGKKKKGKQKSTESNSEKEDIDATEDESLLTITKTAETNVESVSINLDEVISAAQGDKATPTDTLQSKETQKLLKELSIEESGQKIEQSAIGLVTKPFEDVKLGLASIKGKSESEKKDSQQKDAADQKKSQISAEKVKSDEFEHIQKTIDDAMMKLDEFVVMVSDKKPVTGTKTGEKIVPGQEKTSSEPSGYLSKTEEFISREKGQGQQLSTEVTQQIDSTIKQLTEFSKDVAALSTSKTMPTDVLESLEKQIRYEKPIEQQDSSAILSSSVIKIVDEPLVSSFSNQASQLTEGAKQEIQHLGSSVQNEGKSQIQKAAKTIETGQTSTIINAQNLADGTTQIVKTEIETTISKMKNDSKDKAETVVRGITDSLAMKSVISDLPLLADPSASTTQSEGPKSMSRKLDETVESFLSQAKETVAGAQSIAMVEKDLLKDEPLLQKTITAPKDLKGDSGNSVNQSAKSSEAQAVHKDSKWQPEAVVTSIVETTTKTSSGLLSEIGDVSSLAKKSVGAVQESVVHSIDGGIKRVTESVEIKDPKTQSVTKIVKQTVTATTDAFKKPDQLLQEVKIKTDDVIGGASKSITAAIVDGTTNVEQSAQELRNTMQEEASNMASSLISRSPQQILGGFQQASAIEDSKSTQKSLGPESFQPMTQQTMNIIQSTTDKICQEAEDKASRVVKSQITSTSETFRPEFHAQTSLTSTFETLEKGSTQKDAPEVVMAGTGTTTEEISRMIKEMETQLLTSEYGMDRTRDDSSEVDSEDSRETVTMPPTPMPQRKSLGQVGSISFEEETQPVVTTPTQTRRVLGMGGSQRLSQSERPVVRVITEYIEDMNESEPEESTYTVLEPEVRERRKFKIRFSPDMYESEEREDYGEVEIVEQMEPDLSHLEETHSQDDKTEKKIKHIERKFERMASHTKEADPSMGEAMDGEFQKMVSQLSVEEMDQALHQWDVGGLTPSEVDSKDLTLSSDEVTSPLQQGLKDIFKPNISSILPSPTNSGSTEADIIFARMKLSLVKESVPQVFESVETGAADEGDTIKSEQEPGQIVETQRREREEESHESVSKLPDSKGKGPKDSSRK